MQTQIIVPRVTVELHEYVKVNGTYNNLKYCLYFTDWQCFKNTHFGCLDVLIFKAMFVLVARDLNEISVCSCTLNCA